MTDIQDNIFNSEEDTRVLKQKEGKNNEYSDPATEQVNASGEKLPASPLSKEESERLQREANEETTNSEDLRMFLKVINLNYVYFNAF